MDAQRSGLAPTTASSDTALHDNTAGVLLANVVGQPKILALCDMMTNLLCRLVKHLTRSRQRVRAVDEIV